ncbi:interferon-induced very large GTPase 1-like isoform 2-T2 [Odontesthes bonariensis]|uniref:interferon-induced very large GTPase 1-like isoform X2 n=1 Tax=Odontesthes bonariensis TaxID=219752 RepID=UPI003F582828
MEENKGGESETKSVTSVTNDKVHLERNDDTESDPVNDPHDAQHSEKSESSTEGEAETKTASEASDDKVMPELKLVLIGDTNSIEIGSKNILIDHDKQTNMEQFSSKLYDLCGQHICVINMLGLPNADQIPSIQAVHAFILLLPNGLHSSQYRSGIQWLEKGFGKRNLSYVMTVVTHKSDESCESALADLKAESSFSEKRYHTCTRCMMDENQIISLLEKIDVMVSENNPQCYNRQIFENVEEQKEQLDPENHKEERVTTAEEMKTATEIKSKEHDGAERSEKNDDNTPGQSEIKSVPHETKEKDTFNMDISGKEIKTQDISEENRKKQQKETEMLLGRLHLQDKCPHKMSPADFLKIGPPVRQSNDTLEKDLAHTFLQRLMTLDHRARYIPVLQDGSEVSHSESFPTSDTVDADDGELDSLFSTGVDIDQSKQAHVHPMDVQMAVFHCSNSFLKQNMITKVSQCQYALPLLVPDPITMDIECPLWTFRQITKTWKITQDDPNTGTMKSMPICKAETPLVSFFRLGSLSQSKSQLMNTLINNRHSAFFHRNCPGSTKSRHLMDGVAEIAWYCPAGTPNESFNDCIAFCNLHGDSLSIEKQREILTEKSSVIVVLVPTLEKSHGSSAVISTLYRSPKPLIILIADSDCGASQTKAQKYKLGLKDRSQSDVSEELKGIIRKILSAPHKSFQLESMAEVSGIRVDEDGTDCQKGKSAAMEIVKLIQGMDVSKIKDEFLPCQGQLWHEWCRINKELYHLKGHIEKEKAQKEKQLMHIRQKQCAASNSKLIKSFTESLLGLTLTDREYFLKWTQILIDGLSTDDLSSILQSYDETWSEVLTLKKKHDKSALLKDKQTELEQLSKKLQSATFGLEHFFREMGQIYEAHKSQKEQTHSQQADWVKYPELAADLMISGHPMELMDGDAGQVPLMWISSLLQEVIKKLGDKRVFVLSVLGVQSSGKSTMLNAMFGLQFAVSAGRCTKGADMQLVKVSEELKGFQFDYVLVVDTEGLRALELEGNVTLHHDNELATFVVGLGNMTLINIFGENPADMQDVLQIVVQAFMRMKEVELSPSCVFVHQNVTDIAAAKKNMDGKRRLQEKLDKMAQLAAKEEACDVECFSDVIAFDVQEDVKYFAQLWEGSPPMAPPNPDYSESVQELKKTILSKASKSAGITLSHLNSKIQDLWKALMNEHFVFSFKNTQEIAVYRKVEVQYGNWTWDLRKEMLTIENQLYPRIEKGQLDKVELSYLSKEISKTYEEIQKNMTAYFEDHSDKEILIQWRGRFENKIKEFHEEHIRGVKRKLDEVIQQKNARKKMDNKKVEFETKLLQKSKELAHTLKDVVKDEEELKAQFDSVWSHWVTELTSDTKPIEDINVEEDQSVVLQDLGTEWSLINESKRNGRYKKLSEAGNYFGYITQKKYQKLHSESQQYQESKRETKDTSRQGKGVMASAFGYFQQMTGIPSPAQQHVGQNESRNPFPHEEQKLIRSFINDVEQQSLETIKNKPVATRGYRSTYLQEVAKHVQKKVTEFESGKKFTFKKEFTVDLSLYVFDRTASWLLQSHNTYKRNNDALTYLDSKKKEYYNIFRSYCKGNSSAVVFGEMICEKLKVSVHEAVCNKTAVDLAGEMRCNYPAFSGNRLNLEKHVLKSLAEKQDFSGFITYIQNPRRQVEAFIKEEVKKYMFTDHKDKGLKILKKNADDISKLASQALYEATEKVKKKSGDVDMWMKEFSALLNKLAFESICCKNFKDINNFDFLKEEIEKGLVCIVKEMSSLSLEMVLECRQMPDQILIDQLCNCCWERCPFCAAVCINTLKDHSPEKHNVPFHRPSAVNGIHVRDRVDLVIDFCTTLVGSDGYFRPNHDSEETVAFKQYPTAGERFASWRITADASMLAYWKWFVCHFQKELEDHYDLKFQGRGEIPSEWRNYTKKEAIESLDEMCRL